jgi:hypothetical protein
MKPASKEQIEVCKKFHLPVSQAYLINLKKAAAYEEYLNSPKGKVEKYLDEVREMREE